jgi:hypothetical protein
MADFTTTRVKLKFSMDQKDKDARRKAFQEFYDHFAENAQQLFDYDSACHDVISYLLKYGTNGNAIGEIVEVQSILKALLARFEHLDKFEVCTQIKIMVDALQNPSARFSNPSFLYKVETVLNFPENCEVCFELLNSHRMFLFDNYRKVIGTSIAALDYCIIIENYFYHKKQHGRCALIKAHISELIREELEENGLPFGSKDGIV